MVMVVMFLVMVVVIVLFIMVMMVFLVIFVMMFMFLFMLLVVMLLVMDIALQTAYPAGTRFCLTVVEHIGIEQFLQIHIRIVALDYLRLSLDLTDNVLDLVQCLSAHFRRLVQKNDITELNLLNDKVFDIVLLQILAFKALSAAELVSHP